MIRFLKAAFGLLVTTFALHLTTTARAVENTWDYSVQVSSSVQASPATITLSWPQDTNATPASYTVFRKTPDASSWGNGTALPGSATTYVDAKVTTGQAYEYRVTKTTVYNYIGYGYIRTGIDVPLVDDRGKIVLIVDDSFSATLASELARLQHDLAGDGWTVIRHDVARSDPVSTVKNLIVADYNADTTRVKAVFLFGHIAVPYSGQFNPDGHPDHIGAWPADVYYGDVDGNWSDVSVNYVQTINTDPVDAARITNRPGDGKFDQTDIPSNVELQVGRVDLANLPGRTTWGGPATFPSETELLRKYLNKDHDFRNRVTNPARRAIVGDYFGVRGGEAFAASGYRSFAPLVGANNIRNLNVEFNDQQGVWIPQVAQNDYLLAYGCGAGSYAAISGIGSIGAYHMGDTVELVNANVRGVFNLLFGSWLGDWDHEDNILRAPLATDSGLVSVWSGRPHWFIHPMGLGETIGYTAQLNQNNTNTYETAINSAAHRIHIALMGDPTLRLHPVVPAGALTGTVAGSNVALTWTASSDSNLIGYHVYRAATADGSFTRLTATPVTATNFTDAGAPTGATYMVRAIKRENTTSGSYHNPSQGVFWSAAAGSSGGSVTPPATSTDTTAPSITVSVPGSDSTLAGASVAISASVTDNVGVAGVQFKLDGGNLGAEVASAPFATTWNTMSTANGAHSITAIARDAAGNSASASPVSITVSNTVSGNTGSGSGPITGGNAASGTVVWFDDVLPTGASGSGNGENWNWVASGPAPYSGAKAHQSALSSGLHEHSFAWGAPLTVNAGEVLFTYVYLDPANPPGEIMLSWFSDNWEHRAYWGSNSISYGTDKTASRLNLGPLPATGQWVRLEIPAGAVGLEGASLQGMAFSTFNGRATWDFTGKSLPSPTISGSPGTTTTPPTPTTTTPQLTSVDTIWVDDAMPAGAGGGAGGGDTWSWVNANPAPFSGGTAHQSANAAGLHEHYFAWAGAPLTVAAGDKLFAYVYLDPANLPSEIMLSWFADNWEHRAYWGANKIDYGTSNTAGRFNAGALPAGGQWTRLEIPASAVSLEGATVTGMSFSTFDGRATWDATGKSSIATASVPTSVTPPVGTAPTVAPEVIWVDDALPNGATGSGTGGDSWDWVTGSPSPFAGTQAHQSSSSSGLHEHYFAWASSALAVETGEKLFAYVYLDPNSAPAEIMLSWFADNWEHRAYWGADKIAYGTAGTAGHYNAGALPAPGQWVRLEIPASAVGLEGRSVTGMSFSQFGGRATWDKIGKGGASSTDTSSGNTPADTTSGGSTPPDTSSGGGANTGGSNTTTPPPATTTPPPDTNTGSGTATTPPPTAIAENAATRLPQVGDHQLRALTPTMLEVQRITTKNPEPAGVSVWNFVDASGNLNAPATSEFAVTSSGRTVAVKSVGFRRRVAYAPLLVRDLRIDNSLYLELSEPLADGQTVEVKNPSGALWPSDMAFVVATDGLRYSPAIHVNQEGYVLTFPKKAMVGYYLGNKGELDVSSGAGFTLASAATGATVFSGTLKARADTGYTYSPTPYQKVLEADFSSFTTPGEYQLVVPGLGASLPFLINDGIAMAFLRTYELGIYHQRCGADNALPFTRFVHDACHMAPAEVPSPQSSYQFTWATIASKNGDAKNNPRHTAPQLKDEGSQLYPFVNKGTVDVSGGHHDAGDYSKYTINVAQLVHQLIFTADSIEGASSLDNLGVPQSGDGISDIMQEAKQESDYLAKLQDADGGFYFIVYPKNREYEGGVTPDHGDQQVVWPKNTSATAAAVAALAQAASSPKFKAAYPAEAAAYLEKAKHGWQFLTAAISSHGKDGAYQKVTFYGDEWMHDDELAWAACELYLATGESQYQQKLFEWFPNPADPATHRWGWWKMCMSWGNAIRSYAFAARSGRVAASQLDPSYLATCEAQVKAAGDDSLRWSNQNAYGSAFPEETKHVMSAGWYFSLDQGSDMAVAYQLDPKPAYLDALVGNMNYEGGTNPVNVTFLTGLGMKRQREIVSQYALADRRVLPPDGIPLGNVQSAFDYLWPYGPELGKLSFPTDANGAGQIYPFYDRWSDAYNVTTEFVTVNQSRALMALAMIATQTPAKSTAWKSGSAVKIVAPTATVPVGAPLTLTLDTTGLDLSNARIVWEARDQEPDYGSSYVVTPKNNGEQWAEVEITFADGRRVFGTATFNANSPVITWVDDALPAGAMAMSSGGDSWSWIAGSPAAQSGGTSHQSAIASGLHEHAFVGASAPLVIGAGDTMFVYVYLDSANLPEEIMLNWNDGDTWEHRAYWGADKITYGTAGTAGHFNAGALPAAGQWVKLEVPASAVGLEGKSVSGMSFSAYGGRVTWDAAGRASPAN